MRERAVLWAVIIGLVAGVVGIAAVAAGGGGDGPSRLPALALGGGERSSAMAASDSMLAGPIEYRVQGELPDLPDKAAVWTLDAAVTSERVSQLAKALGVDGEVKTAEYGWVVTDGTHTLTVDKGPGHPWSLGLTGEGCGVPADDPDTSVSSEDVTVCSKAGVAVGAVASSGPATAEPHAVVDCPMPDCPPDQVCAQVCPPPDPSSRPLPPEPPLPEPPVPEPVRPADLPTKSEAERLGREVLAATGLDLDGAVVRVEDGFSQWYITAEPQVGGLPTVGWGWSVAIGPKGKVEMANGWLADPQRGDEYPLAGVDKGLERLREGNGVGLGGPRPLMAEVPPVADDVQPLVVTVTGVRLGLMFAPTAEGNEVLLVPAYLFDLDQGGPAPVLAVADEFLPKAPEPQPVPEPGVVPPGGGGGMSECSASGSMSSEPSDNEPLSVELCVSPSTAKVGEEVVFTLTASDPDGPVADDGCNGPTAQFGDEGTTEHCIADCITPPPKEKQPGKLSREFRHTYTKPGTYNARFTIGAACGEQWSSPGSGEVQVTVR